MIYALSDINIHSLQCGGAKVNMLFIRSDNQMLNNQTGGHREQKSRH